MTTSSHAARVAMRTLSPPLLPDPVVPANSACRRRNDTRHCSASSNGPRSTGSVMDRADGPGHGIASACGSVSRTRSSHLFALPSPVG